MGQRRKDPKNMYEGFETSKRRDPEEKNRVMNQNYVDERR